MAQDSEHAIKSHDAYASTTEHIEDDPHRAALEENPEVPEKLTWSVGLSILFLALAFVGPLSCGFVLPVAILAQIGTALGDTSTIAWIPGSWSVASSVSFAIAGSLSDIFGLRYIMLVGELLSIIGCIIAATAQTMNTVIAGSTIIGFACGIIFIAYAGIAEILPNKWRNVGLSITEFLCAIPWAICAVLIGNAPAEHASWRWCYYIGIIYAVIALVGTAIVYFPPSHPMGDFERTRWDAVKSLDYVGILLYTCGLTVFLIGLTWGGSPAHPWKSASTIAPIVAGAVTFGACFVYDFTVAKAPFFPYSLFRKLREFTMLLVIVFVSGMVYYSMAGLLPQGTIYIYTSDPVKLGITQLPNGIAQLVGACILPAISHKLKHLKLQVIIAITVQTIFVALYSVSVPHNKAAWMAFQFFGQGCFGYITLLAYFIAGLHVPLSELGLASGLIGTFRSAGGSVGNAIFNIILSSTVNDKLPSDIAEAALKAGFPAAGLEALIPAVIANALGFPGAFGEIEGASPAVQAATSEALRLTYSYAFKRVFWATIPFGVIAIIGAFFIEDASKYLTNHTAVHLEHNATHLLRHPQKLDGSTVEQSIGQTLNDEGKSS